MTDEMMQTEPENESSFDDAEELCPETEQELPRKEVTPDTPTEKASLLHTLTASVCAVVGVTAAVILFAVMRSRRK